MCRGGPHPRLTLHSGPAGADGRQDSEADRDWTPDEALGERRQARARKRMRPWSPDTSAVYGSHGTYAQQAAQQGKKRARTTKRPFSPDLSSYYKQPQANRQQVKPAAPMHRFHGVQSLSFKVVAA